MVFCRGRHKAICQGQAINLLFPPPRLWRTFLQAVCHAWNWHPHSPLCEEGAFMSDMPWDKTETAARCWALVPQSNLRKSVWLRGERLTLESGTERGLGSNPCSVAFCVTGQENVLSDPQLPHLKCRTHCPSGVVECIKGHIEVVGLYKVQCECQLSKKQGSLVVPSRATEYTCALQWVVLYFHYHIRCATHIPIAGKDLLHGISMESLKNAGYEASVGQP